MLGGVVNVSADGTSTTVYYAVPSYLVNNGSYSVKVNVCTHDNGGSDQAWISPKPTMTYTNKTYLGFRVYSVTFTDEFNGCKQLQFQIYDGDTQKLNTTVINWDWTSVGTYNGKMYVHGANETYRWITPTYDSAGDEAHITYHVQKTNSWTPTNAYIFMNTENYNNGWVGESVTANAFNDGWYDYVVYYPFNKIIFNNGNSGTNNQTDNITISTTKDEYWTTYVSGTTTTVDRDSKPDGWIDYQRTSLTAGNYGTICLPYAADITGADIYKITSTVGSGESLTGINIDAVVGNEVEAGKAYIFKATGTTLTATYSGSYTEASAGYGMMGNLGSSAINVPVGNYVISGNQIHKVVSGGSGVTIGQYKGYITLTDIPSAARGANFISFENETTGINSMDNGQLMMDNYYDLQGRRVVQPTKGLYIVNGKKVIK